MRRSLARRLGLPTTEVRWVIPTQVRNDIEIMARIVGRNGGEVVTIALVRFMETMTERWNQESLGVQIPALPSLSLGRKGYSTRDVLEGLRGLEGDGSGSGA